MSTTALPATSELATLVRRRFTPPSGAARRVGMELEMLPVRAATGTPVAPLDGDDGPGTLGVLRALASAGGWRIEDTGYGVPRFALRDGAVLSYEPGGQLEWSSAVHDRLDTLDAAARGVADRLAAAMADAGIHLLARGVDPATPLDRATMVIAGARYERQRAHYDRRGPAGRAMMLQTAGLHLNLDPGDDPLAAWGVANTLAPLLVAMFANAPTRAGDPAPHRSHRAAIWRALDPTRTGAFAPTRDPVPAYVAFALGAESFLLGAPGDAPRRFGDWLAAGATGDDAARHLTTLFPEIRPRGYLECRSVDALPARLAILPAAALWAALHDAPLRRAVLRELPPATPERLARAGRLGLADAEIGAESRWLTERLPAALAATRGAGTALVGRLEAFLDAYTRSGRDPAGDPSARVES